VRVWDVRGGYSEDRLHRLIDVSQSAQYCTQGDCLKWSGAEIGVELPGHVAQFHGVVE